MTRERSRAMTTRMVVAAVTTGLVGAAVAVLLYSNAAYAVGGDDVNTGTKVDKNTELCSATLGKNGRIWMQKRLDTLNGCLDAILKCDEQSTAAKATDCRKKLVETDKGKCAQGKMDSGVTTIGPGASDGKLSNAKPTLDKELAKYRDAIAKKCFDPNKPVDLTSASTGLEFSSAANADRLMDQINKDPGGSSCVVNGMALVANPVTQDAMAVVLGLQDGTHVAAKAIREGPGGIGLKECAQ
jgi:hypothetical protein